MILNPKLKNLINFLLRFGLSTVLLVYLFHKIDLSHMASTLKSADLRFFFLAAAIFAVIHFIILIRWIVLMKALNLNIPFRNALSCFFIGLFFNLFLPTSTGGDIVKTLFLFKETKEKAKVVATVVADRLVGFCSMVLVGTVAFIFGHALFDNRAAGILISIMAFVLVSLTLVLFNEKLFKFFCRIFNRFPIIQDKFMRFHYAMAFFKKRSLMLAASIGLSCISQCLLAVSFFFFAKSLHQDFSIVYFFIFIPMICVAASMPSIGGLGFRDFGAAYLFGKVGMDTGLAVSMSLMSFLLMVLIGLVGGVFYVIALSPGRLQHNQADTGI